MKQLLFFILLWTSVACKSTNKPVQHPKSPVIAVSVTDEDGNPIDSNTVLKPSKGTRNVFLFDGKEWSTCEYGDYKMDDKEHYLLYIFEFISDKNPNERYYKIGGIGCSHSSLYELQHSLWDCKTFACNGVEYDDNLDSLIRFDVYMNGGMNCGEELTGTLPQLRNRIDEFFENKNTQKL